LFQVQRYGWWWWVYGVKFLTTIKGGICEHQDGNFGRSGRHGNGKKRTCKEEEINDDEEEKIITITKRIYSRVCIKYHIS